MQASSTYKFVLGDIGASMVKKQSTPQDSLVGMLEIVREQLAHYDPATLDLSILDDVLKNELAMQLTGKQLLAANGQADLRATLPLIIAGIRLSDAITRAYTLTFAGFTNGINTGPIVDEVFQMLYSRGQTLAAITQDDNEENWHRLNYAISDGGPGNHTALVYFENMATPIIKNSSFDPTQFVV